MRRQLGRSGIEVSAVGMGCWAIGGPLENEHGNPVGWGKVDDSESIRAIHCALDVGVNFFDTANVYGAGHSERVLGKALSGRWDEVVIATKFGRVFDEEGRKILGSDGSAAQVEQACDASLARLGTDCIDLLQWHLNDWPVEEAEPVRDALESLVTKGKIRYYGWSTDFADRAAFFAEGAHCTAIQQALNVFGGHFDTLAVCEQHDLASINRGPLAMGILTGKFSKESQPAPDDVRSNFDFREGPQAEQLDQLEAIRDILTSGGRTLAQGALAWLWARSQKTIPIPGFRTEEQVRQNAGAMEHGPLSRDQMAEVDRLLGRQAG
jgi:aryl-alcohol dehydrogenase-like predicted oxidoreductase